MTIIIHLTEIIGIDTSMTMIFKVWITDNINPEINDQDKKKSRIDILQNVCAAYYSYKNIILDKSNLGQSLKPIVGTRYNEHIV